MALSIKNAKADRCARKLARRTGESLTEAVRRALEGRLWRLNCRERCGPLRSADDINARAKEELSKLRRRPARKHDG